MYVVSHYHGFIAIVKRKMLCDSFGLISCMSAFGLTENGLEVYENLF